MSVDSGARSGSLVHLEADAVTEPVAECSPSPASAITPRAAPSASAPLTPGPHRLEPRELRRAGRPRTPRELVRQLARRERARAVRAVAVDAAAGVDGHERLPGPISASRVSACGLRAVLAGGDDHVERELRRAELVEERRIRQASSRSVRPTKRSSASALEDARP